MKTLQNMIVSHVYREDKNEFFEGLRETFRTFRKVSAFVIDPRSSQSDELTVPLSSQYGRWEQAVEMKFEGYTNLLYGSVELRSTK
jgi:hypothetical protein